MDHYKPRPISGDNRTWLVEHTPTQSLQSSTVTEQHTSHYSTWNACRMNRDRIFERWVNSTNWTTELKSGYLVTQNEFNKSVQSDHIVRKSSLRHSVSKAAGQVSWCEKRWRKTAQAQKMEVYGSLVPGQGTASLGQQAPERPQSDEKEWNAIGEI